MIRAEEVRAGGGRSAYGGLHYRVKGVSKRFGSTLALDGIDLAMDTDLWL